MTMQLIILTYEDGNKLIKTLDQFHKAIYPVDSNLTRVWFKDGECVDCLETPEQMFEQVNK